MHCSITFFIPTPIMKRLALSLDSGVKHKLKKGPIFFNIRQFQQQAVDQ